MPVIHLFPGRDYGWFVRIVSSPGGEIMLVSESYTRKWSARRAAKRLSSIFGGLQIREVPQ